MDLGSLDLKQLRSLLRAALALHAALGERPDPVAGLVGTPEGPSDEGAGLLGKSEAFHGQEAVIGSAVPVPAAVLVAIVGTPGDPAIVLTKRTPHLENHAGEVSLPGGRVEPHDVGPQETALRETSEEIGLAPDKVEILGSLPPYDTVSGFRVTPYVGWVEPPVAFCPDPREVEEVFTLPLRLVLDRNKWRREQLVRENKIREFLVLDYEGRRIWGATAGILASLAEALAKLKK